jgi:NAD(P)-dependent dehydrogenase (short-subunit alcohol dehydrogenase family)
LSRLGVPTILVNAAGGNNPRVTVTPKHPFEKINVVDWRENFDLNLVGGRSSLARYLGPR